RRERRPAVLDLLQDPADAYRDIHALGERYLSAAQRAVEDDGTELAGIMPRFIRAYSDPGQLPRDRTGLDAALPAIDT
ncbi:MAG: hypothetical protein ABEI97_01270, partial [Candidatus Nanohaloarchaea archaeon]